MNEMSCGSNFILQNKKKFYFNLVNNVNQSGCDDGFYGLNSIYMNFLILFINFFFACGPKCMI